MTVTQEDIEDFQRIWQLEFEEQISEGESTIQINRLMILYELLAEPLPSEIKKLPYPAKIEGGLSG